jgi:hypothetical protein
MGIFDALTEAARSGVADIFGVGALVDENDFLQERLLEASADARMIRRRTEEVGWTNISGGQPAYYFDPDEQVRRDQIRRAHDYYFNDPVGRRSIDLTNFYVLGKGVPPPKYREDPTQKTATQDPQDAKPSKGQMALKDYWTDPENKVTLTGFLAQYYAALEVALQGQKFFTLHPAAGTLDAKGELMPARNVPDGTPSLRVADLPENEIVDIICHPNRRKIPLFYKRQFRRRKYDATGQGAWSDDGEIVTLYYRDWRFRNTENIQWPTGWTPPSDDQIVKGVYVYHLAVNKTGEMRFGLSTMNSYLKWAQGLNQYMTSRMSMVQALAQLALRVKAQGGPVNRQQVGQQLSDIARLAHSIESGGRPPGAPGSGAPAPGGVPGRGLELNRAGVGQTNFAVAGSGVDMAPMISDTGSASASGDIAALQGQIAAGSGIGTHHFGGPGSNMAQSTSIDAPTGKLVEWNQELYETLHRDTCGWAVVLKSASLDADRVEVQMPPMTQRDVTQVAATFASLLQALDPNGQNKPLFRFIFGEILEAMGKVNSQEILTTIFGADWKSPFEVGQEAQAAQIQAQVAAQNSGTSAVTPPDQRAGQAAAITLRQAANVRNGPLGSRAGGDIPGGPAAAGQISRDRAVARNLRARESSFDGAEDLLELLAGVQVEGVPDYFPPEFSEARSDAMSELDALIESEVLGDFV